MKITKISDPSTYHASPTHSPAQIIEQQGW